ncbi:flavodoxin family protein [Microbacterium sp. bgisy207]|uniref:flavodoxin family protein n=1 Tax=Microbacterium sp. bgisy207 TaxID=3413800 RepID=UPI003EBEC260
MTDATTDTTVRAIALNCTLKPSPAASSTELLSELVMDALTDQGVTSSRVRVVDLDIRPGVEADMGDGDEWPRVREQIMAADILILATPTWVGHMSSVAQRVIERLDAEISKTDDEGRAVLAGKVAVVVVTGNEDGAHAIIANAFQALNDVGFTVPSQGGLYWNGEAMHSTDFKDLDQTPENVVTTAKTVAMNAAHLARTLRARPYPAP